jgi:hypothetical protein
MPLKFEIDPQANLITVTGTGRLTYHDFKAGFEERLGHPQYKPGMDILYDLQAASIDITLQEIKQGTAFFKNRQQERGAGFRFAIVVSTVGTYGISHLYQAYAEELPEEIRVFRDMAEAKQWLGMNDLEFQ